VAGKKLAGDAWRVPGQLETSADLQVVIGSIRVYDPIFVVLARGLTSQLPGVRTSRGEPRQP
jgi:hypothetical protein